MKRKIVIALQNVLLTAGCVAVPQEENQLRGRQQALGELRCTTGGPDDVIIDQPAGDHGGYYRWSKDAFYGANRPSCPGQFIVDVPIKLNQPVTVTGGWGAPLPTTPADCERFRDQLAVYGLKQEHGHYFWALLGTKRRVAAWTCPASPPSPLDAGPQTRCCTPMDDPSYQNDIPQPVPVHDALRLVTRAYLTFQQESPVQAQIAIHW